ncbi:MAG: amidohydrolase [Mycobacterium sp.]
MAIRDGAVIWLGTDAAGLEQFPRAERVDLAGALVTPAFVDSHVHLTSTGLRLTGLDLGPATSREHCLRILAGYLAAHPGQPVWGHGWDDTRWDHPPSTDDVDGIAATVPVYLARVDVHSAVANTALRQMVSGLPAVSGFDHQRPLSAEAHHLVRAEARRLLTWEQRDEARRTALDAAAAAGVVAVHECAGPQIGGGQDWAELRELDHGVEIAGYWGEAVSTAAQARALIEATGARGLAGDLFVDGALGSHTAWLTEDYTDAPGHAGTCYLDAETIAEHLNACTEAGVTAGFHVIGDAAVAAVVDAFESVAARFGTAAVARCGHRLEHLEMVSAEQAAKLGAWGVTASVQPNFDAMWGGRNGMYARRLGADRAAGLNPLALLASAGVPLAFGSDTPVTSMNPWSWVHAARHHRTAGAAIPESSAFAAATAGGWQAGGVRDGLTGTLAPGAPASYAVWETGEDATLPRCLRTVHRGVALYG